MSAASSESSARIGERCTFLGNGEQAPSLETLTQEVEHGVCCRSGAELRSEQARGEARPEAGRERDSGGWRPTAPSPGAARLPARTQDGFAQAGDPCAPCAAPPPPLAHPRSGHPHHLQGLLSRAPASARAGCCSLRALDYCTSCASRPCSHALTRVAHFAHACTADDESFFFAPSILNLLEAPHSVKASLLCLSVGAHLFTTENTLGRRANLLLPPATSQETMMEWGSCAEKSLPPLARPWESPLSVVSPSTPRTLSHARSGTLD